MGIKKTSLIVGLIFLIGIILRFIVFNINACYIHDDAALAVNIINKSYLELFKGLEYCQVAPPLFLIISKFIYNISPNDYQTIDLYLKILPFLSSIISIPLFYVLSNLLLKEKQKLYIANLLFALNPLLVSLGGRFKQYSIEVTIAILLYIIFYKYFLTGMWKKYWYFIILIAPWMSLSSLIILFSCIIIMYIKNKQFDKKALLIILSSILLFLTIYLPNNFQLNYNTMNTFWSNYGFMSILHPQRFFIRIGEFFLYEYKLVETILGLLILYKIYEYIKNQKTFNVMFCTLPILITILLSCLHLYPFTDRLIAFLVPLFIIMMSEYGNNYSIQKFLSTFFIIISLITLYITISETYNLPNYRNNPVQYLNNENKINKEYRPFYPVYKWYTHLE